MSQQDTFGNGQAYEPYVGRWSRVVAVEFVRWLAIAPESAWLDVGCGTGALTQAILQQARPAMVRGIDPAEGFVAFAARQILDARASFRVGNALALPFDDDAFDAVVSGLALNFMPRTGSAVAEMVRVTRPGGTVAVYVWDYAGQMQMMRVFWDAVVELDPAASEHDEGSRFPICAPQPLTGLFRSAGLSGVQVRAIDITTVFRGFDDYWLPFLGGQGPASSFVTSLGEERRVALRERIRSRLPVAPDGSISLLARAWAVRGTKSAPQNEGP